MYSEHGVRAAGAAALSLLYNLEKSAPVPPRTGTRYTRRKDHSQ
jgi:hypothetical protein